MSMDIIHNTLYTPLIKMGDMSTTLTGKTAVQGITVFTIQADWSSFNQDTGAKITVSASNDDKVYTAIDSIVPTGATNSYMLNQEKAGYRFVKVDYVPVAGSGLLTVTISGKII